MLFRHTPALPTLSGPPDSCTEHNTKTPPATYFQHGYGTNHRRQSYVDSAANGRLPATVTSTRASQPNLELAFMDGKTVAVDLFNAKPPSKALLPTCRQINAEATKMYQDAYRKFWTDSSFTVEDGQMAADYIGELEERNIRHIKNLLIGPVTDAHWVRVNGLWRMRSPTHWKQPNAWLTEEYLAASETSGILNDLPFLIQDTVKARYKGCNWYQYYTEDDASEAQIKKLHDYASLKPLSKGELWAMVKIFQ